MTALKKGFTLIELLIVMAILGVLAVVVLVAINPAEQLARARDAGRISAVAQLGHAVQAYYTAQNADYPGDVAGVDWNVDLVTSGEISTFPGDIAYATTFTPGACVAVLGNPQDNWCFNLSATNGGLVYTRLESTSWESRCGVALDGNTYAVFSTGDGRGGVVCDIVAEPAAWAPGGAPGAGYL